MSLLRSVEGLNSLPLSLYLTRFFDSYEKYFKSEIKKLNNTKLSDKIEKAVLRDNLEFLEFVIKKIEHSKYDVEIISDCTKFLRIMDCEITTLRMELRRVVLEDVSISEDLKKLQNERNVELKQINSFQQDLDCWKVMLRMRNINVTPTMDKYDIKFCLDDEEHIEEIPSVSTKPVFIVCNDFMQEGRYALASAFVNESIKNMLKINKLKPSLDLAILHGYMGQILHLNEDNESALEHYKISLNYREKMLKPQDPAIGTLMYNYSLALIKSKKLADAEKMLGGALKIKKQEFGNDNLLIAKIYSLLGLTLELERKYSEAIGHYKLTLAILEKLSINSLTFYTGVCVALCRNYIEVKEIKSTELVLSKLFKELHQKTNVTREETVFEYFKRSLNNANGDYVHKVYGSIEPYDVCNLVELLVDYYKNFPVILKTIETWKILSSTR